MPRLQTDIAVDFANQTMALVAQIKSLRTQIAEIVKVNTDTPLGNFWTVLQTTPLLADGSLGTADAAQTPNAAHPIDTRIYVGLARAVKSGDLTNALQILVDLNTFCNGTQVNANSSRPGQINNVAL